MTIFLQQVFNGLTLGSIYGLVALGLTLVYGILYIPNFAHAALYMVVAFISYFLMVDIGIHYWVAMAGAGAAAVIALLAILCWRLVFHKLRNAPPIHDKIAAIGILLFLDAMVHLFWGSEFRRMSTPFSGVINFEGVYLREQGLLIIGFAEAFGGFYISDAYKDVIAFGLLVVILSVRPQGMFSKGAH